MNLNWSSLRLSVIFYSRYSHIFVFPFSTVWNHVEISPRFLYSERTVEELMFESEFRSNLKEESDWKWTGLKNTCNMIYFESLSCKEMLFCLRKLVWNGEFVKLNWFGKTVSNSNTSLNWNVIWSLMILSISFCLIHSIERWDDQIVNIKVSIIDNCKVTKMNGTVQSV